MTTENDNLLFTDIMHNLVINVPGKGRCVFARKDYKKGDVVEVCEYIRIPAEQTDAIKKTIINDYRFGPDGPDGDAVILLGQGSLYNHSRTPNMQAIVDDRYKVGFEAIVDIKKYDELTFNYGYTPKFEILADKYIDIKKPSDLFPKKKNGNSKS